MYITDLSIKNSLTIFVLIFILIFVGFLSYTAMPREAAPDIQIPYIIVNTLYLGVSPSDVETLITNPIEKKLKKLKNVKQITSTSGDSFSSIIVEFEASEDIDEALRKVKEKVDEAKKDLPNDTEDPEILEINLSEIPIMVVNISGDFGLVRLKNIAENIKDQLETIKGILDITISGGLEREIKVLVDKNSLKKHELSLNQISQAINYENVNIPGGNIDIGSSKYLIRIPGEFKNPQEIENIVIDTPGDKPIYIRDVAKVIDHFKERESYSRLNNKESVSLSIQKRSGENVIAIANKVKSVLEQNKKKLPQTIEIAIIADQSKEISQMVDELENSIVLGLILVIAVLFLIMGKRNAFFVGIAIPLSLLVSFIFLNTQGFTLNMVLLFSLILSLGMLVDNAIVIVENIYRFLEEGYSKIEAAKKATHEVSWPVISSTATTIAVFFPIMFMPGIPGKFMRFLPIGVITTITASLFVALIINPVICAHLMKKPKKKNKKDIENSKFSKIQNRYKNILIWSLNNRKRVIISSLAAFFLSIFLFLVTSPGVEFFPEVTPDQIYIDMKAPEENNVDGTNEIASSIEAFLFTNKNIERIITTVGKAGGTAFAEGATKSSEGRIIVEFKDKENRIENPNKTITWIRKKLKDIPGADIKINKEDMGPPTGSPIGVKVSGPNYLVLVEQAKKIKNVMENMPGIVDIKDDYVSGRPEIVIDIDREKAAILGLNTMMIASTIRTAIQGNQVSVFREDNDEYDITLMFPKSKKRGIKILEELFIAGPEGVQIPLLEVAKISTKAGMGSIQHLDSDRVITISAQPQEGFLANDRMKALDKKLKTIKFESGYSVSFVGESEMQDTMARFLKKSFFIALFLIALILVTQFNSLLLPIIIMCSIFLSIMGILLGLVVFHRPFGIMMTGIGVISLAGVIVNNAIVLIDYIRQLRERGLDKVEAVIQAGVVRLRPVMLTAITTVLGLVPMTFGINFNFKYFFLNFFKVNPISNLFHSIEIGSQSTEFWGSMGSAVTIGLVVGTVLTLLIVPVLYVSLTNLKHSFLDFIKVKFNIKK
jgi:multidrug efflux pump